MSQPDIITGEAPGRYAKALLELADQAKSLKTVEKNMVSLKAMFENSDDLRAMVNNPVFADEDKVNALTAIANKAKFGALATNFIGTVAQNQRAAELPAIISAFQNLLALRKGSEVAQVASAKKLTVAQANKIKAELKAALGHKVDLETEIDPSLLGGFVVRIGSKLYDNSLKTKLSDLKLALKSA